MSSEPNLRRATPYKFLAGLAALMVATAWLAVVDHTNREKDESRVLPTALGETRWHSGGTEMISGELVHMPVAYYQGKPLYLQGRVAKEFRADRMLRVGDTDSGDLGIYQLSDRDGKMAPELYVMSGIVPGEPGRAMCRPVGLTPRYVDPGAAATPDGRDGQDPGTSE